MTDKIVVLSTCSSQQEAHLIARELVEKRLAACVNITPGISSFYHWEGAIQQDSEYLLLIKSRRDLFERLCQELEKMHSYDVPEVIALSMVDVSQAYLDWMDRELHRD